MLKRIAKTRLYVDPKVTSEKTKHHRPDTRTSNNLGQFPSLSPLETMIPRPKNQEHTYKETNIFSL